MLQRELYHSPQSQEILSSRVKRSIFLSRLDVRAKLEADGSSSWVHSAAAKKLVFGREAAEPFKIQAGVRIPLKTQDLLIRTAPSSAAYSARGSERIHATQSVALLTGECPGSVRTIRLENRGDQTTKT